MSDPIGFANRRLEKLNESMLHLMDENKELRRKLGGRNDPLVAKVRRLEQEVATSRSVHAAQERLLKFYSDKEEAEKQVRDKAAQAADKSEA